MDGRPSTEVALPVLASGRQYGPYLAEHSLSAGQMAALTAQLVYLGRRNYCVKHAVMETAAGYRDTLTQPRGSSSTHSLRGLAHSLMCVSSSLQAREGEGPHSVEDSHMLNQNNLHNRPTLRASKYSARELGKPSALYLVATLPAQAHRDAQW